MKKGLVWRFVVFRSFLMKLWNYKVLNPAWPILIKNKPISNFKEKANHFNSFFASQCTPVSNNSTLPLVTSPVTNASLSSISSNDQDILKIIHSLNINKAHGYDDISITLLKICDSSILKPLPIIFKNCLQSGSFPNNWEIQMFYLFIKKVTRNLYKTIGLFLYCQYGVKFLREIFSTLSLNISNKIVFSVQINLVFAHLIHAKTNYYQSFMTFMLILDQQPILEMRANFLDILKAFDKMWHQGLLFKLEHIGISGNLLSLLKSLLSNIF